MVYSREDDTEEITDWYFETKKAKAIESEGMDKFNGITIETDNGYFKYWIPVIENHPDHPQEEKILGLIRMKIVEAPGQENESQYTGRDSITVPNKVIMKAEAETEATYVS